MKYRRAVGLLAPLFSIPLSLSVPMSPVAASSRAPQFDYCFRGGGINCVVDGDTFWIGGEKVRIADIDAPETHPPRCAREAALGNAATRRLHALLNAGAFELVSADRDTDRYGRKLRIVVRNGSSIGEKLVAEGLARRWDGARRPWCPTPRASLAS